MQMPVGVQNSGASGEQNAGCTTPRLSLWLDRYTNQQARPQYLRLKKELPAQVEKCLLFFSGVDRSVGGYEGLIAAQDCLPDNDTRDKFAASYSKLLKHRNSFTQSFFNDFIDRQEPVDIGDKSFETAGVAFCSDVSVKPITATEGSTVLSGRNYRFNSDHDTF